MQPCDKGDRPRAHAPQHCSPNCCSKVDCQWLTTTGRCDRGVRTTAVRTVALWGEAPSSPLWGTGHCVTTPPPLPAGWWCTGLGHPSISSSTSLAPTNYRSETPTEKGQMRTLKEARTIGNITFKHPQCPMSPLMRSYSQKVGSGKKGMWVKCDGEILEPCPTP